MVQRDAREHEENILAGHLALGHEKVSVILIDRHKTPSQGEGREVLISVAVLVIVKWACPFPTALLSCACEPLCRSSGPCTAAQQ